jgi:hypothetical protein
MKQVRLGFPCSDEYKIAKLTNVREGRTIRANLKINYSRFLLYKI